MDLRQYGIYHLRWQLSTVVMSLPITLLEKKFPVFVALAIAQFIGACAFWYIDSWIFNE